MADNEGQGARDQVDEAQARLERDGIQHVRFELPDMHGSARSKQVPVERFADSARDGVNMYGGIVALDTASHVIPGTLYNEEVKYKDQTLRPDLSTLAPVPWLDSMAKVICDTEWEDGTPLHAAPRRVARRMLEKAAALGFGIQSAHEYEFYVLNSETHQPLFGGLHIFNNLRNDHIPAIRDVIDGLRAAGIPMLTANAEYAPSQYELVYSHAEGMAGIDSAFTFKNGVKEIVQHAGLTATFMGKPSASSAGSGCHYHISLFERGEWAERLLRPRQSKRDDADAPALRAGHHRPRRRLHGALQPDAQLLPPAHAPHLRALQRELGRGGPQRDGAHQAARHA